MEDRTVPSAGALDPTFGFGGRVTVPFDLGFSNDPAFATALQNDGKIVLAGRVDRGGGNSDFGVVRLNADGTLDGSFGSQGKVVIPFDLVPGGADGAHAVAIYSSSPHAGKIVVAGTAQGSTNDFAVARLNLNGTLDTTFSGDGRATIGFGTGLDDQAFGVVIQNDGKIVLAGSATSATLSSYAVARFTDNGASDPTFGFGGRAELIALSRTEARATGVAMQNNNIVVGGYYRRDDGFGDAIAAFRLLPTGFADPQWNVFQYRPSGLDPRAHALAVQPDNKIVLAGTERNTPVTLGNDFLALRLNTDGSPDTSFGLGGTTRVGFDLAGSNDDVAYGVAIYPPSSPHAGKIVLVGRAETSPYFNPNFAVARLNPAGFLDTAFDYDGKATTDFVTVVGGHGTNDSARAVSVLNDGRVIVVGTAHVTNTPNWDFGAVRFRADGALDTTFGGGDGKVTVAFDYGRTNDNARAVTIQRDGKILLAGHVDQSNGNRDFGVVRLHPNGELDQSFGNMGQVIISFDNFGTLFEEATSVAVQPYDDKIVVAGWAKKGETDYDYAVARLNVNGTLDTSFGVNGKNLITTFGGSSSNSDDRAYGVLIQDDRKIVLVGAAGRVGQPAFRLYRLMPEGYADVGFGSSGWATVPLGGLANWATSVVMQSGKILVGGYSQRTATDYAFAVARLNLNNGLLDTTFSGGGATIISLGGTGTDARANALAVDRNGRIVLAGEVKRPTTQGYDFALARLTANGAPDGSFGGGLGYQSFAFDLGGYNDDRVFGVAVQSDGKIILAGGAHQPYLNSDFAVMRLHPDGTPDNTFDGDGRVLVDFEPGIGFGTNDYGIGGVALQQDGKLVLAGFTQVPLTGNWNFGIARLLGDDPDLVVNCTNGADDIMLRSALSDPSTFEVVVNGQLRYSGLWTSLRSLTINALAGADAIRIDNVGANIPVTLNAGDGNDTVTVGAPGSSLSWIQGPLTINGQAGSDTLHVTDQAATGAHTYVISNTAVDRDGAALISYGSIDSLLLTASNQGDFIAVVATPAGVPVALDAAGGSDVLDYSAHAPGVYVWLAYGYATGFDGGIYGVEHILGSPGNDVLRGDGGANYLAGGGGNDLLLGYGGSDYLDGGPGRDILIGGWGADVLVGGGGDDILIDGLTAYDDDDGALGYFLYEWARTDLDYYDRVNRLLAYLNDGTVYHDEEYDELYGQDGLDWLWAEPWDSTDWDPAEYLN